MKHRVERTGYCKSYAKILHTANHLLDHAQKYEEGSTLQLQACVVFIAFSFEAYLNHVGAEEIPFWEEIEHVSHKQKLKILQQIISDLYIDQSTRPFQSLRQIFSLRNQLAHGRTKNLDQTYTTDKPPTHEEMVRVQEWDELTVDDVQRYYDDLVKANEIINSARHKPDELLFNQGIFSYMISPKNKRNR